MRVLTNPFRTRGRRRLEPLERLQLPRRPEVPERPRPLDRLFPALAAGLLVLFALLAWLASPGGIGTGQDDAIYVFLARSLRSFGYHDLYLVGTPAHNMYPPVYPATLALLSVLVGERIALLQAFGIAAATAALGVTAVVLRSLWSTGVALVVLTPLVFNPHLVGTAGKIGSDAIYLLFSLLALWLLARTPPTPRLLLAAGALAILAALSRSVGVTLLGALALHWLLERRYAAVALFTAASAATVGFWLLWTALAPEQYVGRSYIADAGFRGEGPQVSFAMVLLERATSNLPLYFGSFIPNRIGIPQLPGPAALDLLVVVGVAVALLAGLLVLWRRWRPAALYLLAYGALLTFWPWALGRFLNVLIPLLVAAVLLGAGALAQRVNPRWRFPAIAALGFALALVGGIRSARLIQERSACDWGSELPPAECRRGMHGAFFDALEYVDRNVPAGAVIVSGKPAPVYFFTGRPTIALMRAVSYSPQTFPELLREERVRYVILGGLHPVEYHSLAPLLEASCDSLVLEAEFEPRTYVFRFEAAGVAAHGPACRAIAEYRAAGPPREAASDP